MVKVHVPVEFKESKIAKLTFLRVHKKCFLYLYLDSVSQSESANIPLILTMVKFSQFQDDSCPYRIESYGPCQSHECMYNIINMMHDVFDLFERNSDGKIIFILP